MREGKQQVAPRRRRGWVFVALVPLAILLTAVSVYAATGLRGASAAEPPVESFAGFTKVATTKHYVVVLNVLPAEEMFTRTSYEQSHPTVGELVVDGRPTPRPPSSRHTEAHIYSQATGLPVTNVRPRLTLVDHTSGSVRDVDATLMQDVVIGAPDLHFGSNVIIPSGHQFTIVVSIGAEEVSFDGLLG